MIQSQDFKEFLESLNANNVEYLVIGGYAVAFHGHPRYTKDIDIWVSPAEENIHNLLNALDDFGFSSLGLTVDDFNDPEQIIQLGYAPNRIDLLTDLEGVDFETCYTKKVVGDIDNMPLNFIDLGKVKKKKKITGRNQDLADLEKLE